MRADPEKSFGIEGNPDMEKPFSDSSGQIKLPGNEALRRFGGLSVELPKTKRAPGGTKPFNSGKPAVSIRK
ncbi:MAG: hypothetical protein ACYC6G_09010 [Desulfobaccales bacterium]